MKILVTGANGQLGKDVVGLLKKTGKYEVFSYTKGELDITDEKATFEKVKDAQPDWIFHCAAYTNVEAAEDEGKDLNWQINKNGSANISKAAAAVHSNLIFISTDYVFDGTKLDPYEPSDSTNPINEYGAAKLAGEKEILRYSPNAHIIRTSWVFGENGHNFVYTMLKLAEKMNTLKVVNDQYGRPTYANDLAAFMIYIVEHHVPSGIYHFSNDEQATWFEFAKEILINTDVKVLPVDSTAFPQKARRPKHCVMSIDKVKETGFIIPTWKNALERFMDNINGLSKDI